MSDIDPSTQFESFDTTEPPGHGGFVALAIFAAAVGAGAAILLAPEEGAKTRQRVGRGLRSLRGDAAETMAQLQREIRRRRNQSRREKRIIALSGLLIGAGIAALLTPESGSETRKRLGGTLSRIKVGAVDRLDRLRERPAEPSSPAPAESPGEQPGPAVHELGRDPNIVV
ncbi:MAG TPA: YtxH domain-containing protein [Gemmatimonadales bacterium]|nr:YtxH domain-containing protein [Gemmatimonadales bacterium]